MRTINTSQAHEPEVHVEPDSEFESKTDANVGFVSHLKQKLILTESVGPHFKALIT